MVYLAPKRGLCWDGMQLTSHANRCRLVSLIADAYVASFK